LFIDRLLEFARRAIVIVNQYEGRGRPSY